MTRPPTSARGFSRQPANTLRATLLLHQLSREPVRANLVLAADARKYVNRSLVRGALHAACAIDRLRRREAANTRRWGVRSAARPGDGCFRSTERPGNGPHRLPGGPQYADLVSFVLLQMRIGSHDNT